jgi:HEAT repeat protein
LISREIILQTTLPGLKRPTDMVSTPPRLLPIFIVSTIIFLVMINPLFADDAVVAARTKQVDILRYGIESQVIELLVSLSREKNNDYSEDIIKIFDSSSSVKMKSAIFDYYGSFDLDSVAARALAVINNRENMDVSLVGSAFEYLLKIKFKAALDVSIEVIKEDEKRFFSAAIKLIGAIGNDDNTSVLKTLYESEGTDEATKEQIVLALGEMKAKSSYVLLAEIAASSEASMVLRMYACSALGELGDPAAIPVLINASIAMIPNVRAYAIAALGTFTEREAKIAVREGLRDPHVLVRIAAAKATANSHDEEAVPFLEFKILEDPEKAVREAAIEALAEIGSRRAEKFLADFISDSKNPALYRGDAFGALIKNSRKAELDRLLSIFKSAQVEKDRSVFTIFAKRLILIDSTDGEPFIMILLEDTDYQMRLGAIAWIDRNRNKGFVQQLRKIAENDAVDSVKRRATQALDRIDS